MSVGDRFAAVKTLEAVHNLTSDQSEFGGEVKLEYAMALETVERYDEAGKIYGTLAMKSWSQKIKYNAVALLQGLEITRQIKKDKSPPKPIMDLYSMQKISDALRPGLRNEWDEYSKKSYSRESTPWLDDESKIPAITKVTSMSEAYRVLLSCLDPLKKISSDIINQAFVFIDNAPETDKVTLLRSRGIIAAIPKPKDLIPQYARDFSMFNTTTTNPMDGPSSAEGFNSVLFKMTGGLNPVADENIQFQILTKSKKTEKKVYDLTIDDMSNVYLGNLNGTWDLVLSLKIETDFLSSQPIPRSKRYDYGELRRILLTDPRSKLFAQEIYPTLWGLSIVKITHDIQWTRDNFEIIFSGSQIAQSVAPWQKRSQSEQSVEVC